MGLLGNPGKDVALCIITCVVKCTWTLARAFMSRSIAASWNPVVRDIGYIIRQTKLVSSITVGLIHWHIQYVYYVTQ